MRDSSETKPKDANINMINNKKDDGNNDDDKHVSKKQISKLKKESRRNESGKRNCMADNMKETVSAEAESHCIQTTNAHELCPRELTADPITEHGKEVNAVYRSSNSTVEALSASLAALSHSTSHVMHSISTAVQHGGSRLYDNLTSTDYYSGTLGNDDYDHDEYSPSRMTSYSFHENDRTNSISLATSSANHTAEEDSRLSNLSATNILHDSSADINFDFLEGRGAELLGVEPDDDFTGSGWTLNSAAWPWRSSAASTVESSSYHTHSRTISEVTFHAHDNRESNEPTRETEKKIQQCGNSHERRKLTWPITLGELTFDIFPRLSYSVQDSEQTKIMSRHMHHYRRHIEISGPPIVFLLLQIIERASERCVTHVSNKSNNTKCMHATFDEICTLLPVRVPHCLVAYIMRELLLVHVIERGINPSTKKYVYKLRDNFGPYVPRKVKITIPFVSAESMKQEVHHSNNKNRAPSSNKVGGVSNTNAGCSSSLPRTAWHAEMHIVRELKKVQSMPHKELFDRVALALQKSFSVNEKFFKTCIDHLIDKEFIVRTSSHEYAYNV